MKKHPLKQLVSLCAAVALCGALALQGVATDTPVGGTGDTGDIAPTVATAPMTLIDTLDLTAVTENVTEAAYTWEYNAEESVGSTLTITNALTITIDAGATKGLVLPKNTTVNVNAPLTIDTREGAIYYSHGDAVPNQLTLNVNAETNITTKDLPPIFIEGQSAGLSLNVGEGVVMNLDATGRTCIYQTSSELCSIVNNGNLTLQGDVGMSVGGTLWLSGSGSYLIEAGTAIRASGDMPSNLNLRFGAWGESATLDLTTGGRIYCNAFGANQEQIQFLLNGATVNGLLRLSVVVDSQGTNEWYEVVCGDFTPDEKFKFRDNVKLSFAQGASLTVPADRTLDVSLCTPLDITGGTIVNYGKIVLGEGKTSDDIKALGIALQDGATIQVPTETGFDLYDNGGNRLSAAIDLVLGDVEQTEETYTWLKNAEGGYTLTFLKESGYRNMTIGVEHATINLTQDVSVGSIFTGYQDAQGNDCSTNLTVMGAHTLTVPLDKEMLLLGACGVSGCGTLTIAEGTTVNAPMLNIQPQQGADAAQECVTLAVHGTLIANQVTTADTLVSDTGRMELTYSDALDELIWLNMPFVAMKLSGEPTLTLGSNVAVLYPEGAVFHTEKIEFPGMDSFYMGAFALADGSAAKSVTIGALPPKPTPTPVVTPEPTAKPSKPSTGGATVIVPEVAATPAPTAAVPTSPATGETNLFAWIVAWFADLAG